MMCTVSLRRILRGVFTDFLVYGTEYLLYLAGTRRVNRNVCVSRPATGSFPGL
ncbi:MAG: hypothetical protein LBG18_04480 [Mediterranea sp.]|nr:hypothetical protein [Mediterranea sp.]